MLYTVIVNTKDNQELVFKHVLYFVAEPGLIKMLRRKWIEVEGVQGIILHEESEMSRLSDDEKRYLTDQITMLKNENERLTKYVEELDSAHAQVDKWTEKAGNLQTELARLEAESKKISDALTGAQVFAIKLKAEKDALLKAIRHEHTLEGGNQCVKAKSGIPCRICALLTEEQD